VACSVITADIPSRRECNAVYGNGVMGCTMLVPPCPSAARHDAGTWPFVMICQDLAVTPRCISEIYRTLHRSLR
jgi:hypothetical protein